MKNVFDKAVSDELIRRVNQLEPSTQALWGKMDVAKMLAHCNVTYEMAYENKHKKAGTVKAFILKLLVKPIVVGPKPYKKNSRTAPEFIIANERDFKLEKKRLVDYIQKTFDLGIAHFEGKASLSFGNLTASEWSNLFYKHIDHHLNQFGV